MRLTGWQHDLLCFAIVAAGAAAATTMALEGSPTSIGALASVAYGLAAAGFWCLFDQMDGPPARRLAQWVFAVCWPVSSLLMITVILLPPPPREQARD